MPRPLRFQAQDHGGRNPAAALLACRVILVVRNPASASSAGFVQCQAWLPAGGRHSAQFGGDRTLPKASACPTVGSSEGISVGGIRCLSHLPALCGLRRKCSRAGDMAFSSAAIQRLPNCSACSTHTSREESFSGQNKVSASSAGFQRCQTFVFQSKLFNASVWYQTQAFRCDRTNGRPKATPRKCRKAENNRDSLKNEERHRKAERDGK